MFYEYILAIIAFAFVALVPLLALGFSIAALVRTRRMRDLQRRLETLEAALWAADGSAAPPVGAEPELTAQLVTSPTTGELPEAGPRRGEAIDWEKLVGQKALGWVAVVLLAFAAVFFLRYAYQSNWIGPVGRVATSGLIGVALVVAGQRYHRRGWRVLAQMLSAGGMVVVYLASYSAFGFYYLLPQFHAGSFLALIVVECAILAVMYDSVAIALVSVIGGLLTPLLLQADHDSFVALFTYLAVFNLGTVVLMLLRSWPAIGPVALLGTQGLYWMWYSEYYHPEKLAWALGFQLVLFGLYLGHLVIAQLALTRRSSLDGLLRIVLLPVLVFTAVYVLLRPDYSVWMGSGALLVATLHAALARAALWGRSRDDRLSLTCLAVAVGFIAFAFPIQANAHWVAFGWAVTAAALWWFGLRIDTAALRGMATGLATMAVARVLVFDLPGGTRLPFIPVFNEFALPAIGVAASVLFAAAVTLRFPDRLGRWGRLASRLGGVAGILLLWLILSIDCHGYFESWVQVWDGDRARFRWLGQLALSVLWACYASIILMVGFRWRLAPLRWLAIGLYLVTVGKVFFVDMANLQQFYRILAFFILAVVLGLAARAYQKLGSVATRQDRVGA